MNERPHEQHSEVPHPPRIDPSEVLNELHDNRTESRNEMTAETFSFFKDMLTTHGFTEYKDVNQAYRSLPGEKMIVRREDPKNVLKLFSPDSSYNVGFADGERYSNCVEWNPHSDGPRNISNAYLEGFTNLNSVVTVIGMERMENDDIVQLEDATQNFYGLERQGVRSYKGPVTQERVRFINLRIPGHLLPESELTGDELDRVDEYLDHKEAGRPAQPIMIHRSYVFEHSDEEDTQMKKAA